MADLTTFSVELFKRIDSWISPIFDRTEALEQRLDKLEQGTKATLADSYKGVYAEHTQYHRGDLATRSGSLWLALTKTNRTPGASSDWKMIVKKGGTP